MVRTQIQLSREDYDRLREVASREGRSMADCIREGIALFLRRARVSGGGDLSDVPVFRSRAMDDLKDHDRGWAEAVSGRTGRRKR
jgi:hypothetical protein